MHGVSPGSCAVAYKRDISEGEVTPILLRVEPLERTQMETSKAPSLQNFLCCHGMKEYSSPGGRGETGTGRQKKKGEVVFVVATFDKKSVAAPFPPSPFYKYPPPPRARRIEKNHVVLGPVPKVPPPPPPTSFPPPTNPYSVRNSDGRCHNIYSNPFCPCFPGEFRGGKKILAVAYFLCNLHFSFFFQPGLHSPGAHSCL